MLNDEKHPTVSELADDTGLNQNEVRKVVRALEKYNIIAVEEPGDRITAALQQGFSTTATPTTVKPEVAPDFDIPRTHDREKG
jgi:DNA-binding transcriptional regulator YhcF (GntR family)